MDEGTAEAAPEAARQAVGGGCQSGWRRLLSLTNAIEAGTWRQGDVIAKDLFGGAMREVQILRWQRKEHGGTEAETGECLGPVIHNGRRTSWRDHPRTVSGAAA